jgi:hypothetical protein
MKKLLEESLDKQNTISSKINAIDVMTYEKSHIQKEHSIPTRYHIDTVVFMPISLERSFVYWEITQSLLNEHNISSIDSLHVKIINKENMLLKIFQLNSEVGEYFINESLQSDFTLIAQVGYFDIKNEFVEILSSKETQVFYHTSNYLDSDESIYDRVLHYIDPNSPSSSAHIKTVSSNMEKR